MPEKDAIGKCTILGGSGVIGSRLTKRLCSSGYDCSVPSREDLPNLSGFLGHVFYCIGLTADFRTYPLETVDAHVCLLKRLLRACTFTSLTYLSSTRVYQGAQKTLGFETMMVVDKDASTKLRSAVTVSFLPLTDQSLVSALLPLYELQRRLLQNFAALLPLVRSDELRLFPLLR